MKIGFQNTCLKISLMGLLVLGEQTVLNFYKISENLIRYFLLLLNTASFDLTQGCLSAAQVADIAKQGYSLADLVTVTVANNVDNPDEFFQNVSNTVKYFLRL